MGWIRRGRKSEFAEIVSFFASIVCCCGFIVHKYRLGDHDGDKGNDNDGGNGNNVTMVHQDNPSNSILLLHPPALDPTHFVSRQSSLSLRALGADHSQGSSPKTFLPFQIQNPYRGRSITSITPPKSSSNSSQFHKI